MKHFASDFKFIFGYVLAHLLLMLTFSDKAVFWYLFTASMLFLISYATLNEDLDDQVPLFKYLSYGTFSGLILFTFFWIGKGALQMLNIPLTDQISNLYSQLGPSMLWHYIVLMLVIIPGEEIFWRGFVLKRLSKHLNVRTSIITSSILYASANIYSGSLLLLLTALIAGVFWGLLYTWKKSLPLVIVSHLIFDLCLFVLFPFA